MWMLTQHSVTLPVKLDVSSLYLRNSYVLTPHLTFFQTAGSWSPTLRWKTAASSTATRASARCSASPEQRSCSSPAPAPSWWAPAPWRAPCPSWPRLCSGPRSANWRSSTTPRTVRQKRKKKKLKLNERLSSWTAQLSWRHSLSSICPTQSDYTICCL